MPRLTIAALVLPFCSALRPPVPTNAPTRRWSATVGQAPAAEAPAGASEPPAAEAFTETERLMERDGFAVVETTLLTRPVLDAAHARARCIVRARTALKFGVVSISVTVLGLVDGVELYNHS